LPRACYASLCKDAAGDDAGSLSRELLAYVVFPELYMSATPQAPG
jgi:hypothetical protein